MPKKKQKLDKRINTLFDGVTPEDAPAKSKRTPKVQREAGRQVLDQKTDTSSRSGSYGRAASQNILTQRVDSMVVDNGNEMGVSPSLSLAFQMDQTNWATLHAVDEEHTRTWSTDDQLLIKQVTDQLSLALENANLFQETQKQAQELAIVAQISSAISTILDPKKLLETAVHLVQREFQLYHCHIFILQNDMRTLSVQACGWIEGDLHEGTHGLREIDLHQEVSLVARAARTRQAVIVNDAQADPGWLANPYLPEVRSEMAVPVIAGDQLLGVMNFHSQELNHFTPNDIAIQTTLAAQVATTYQNARLFQEVQQLNQAIQSSNDSIVTTDIDGNITQVNRAFTLMSGYSPEEAIGKTPRILKSGLQAKEMYTRMWATITAGEIWQSELINKRKDGTFYSVHQTILPMRDSEGKTIGFLSLERDITESKQAQEALARSEADLRALFSSMEDVVLVVDGDGRYVRIAPTNPARLVRPPEELLGRLMHEVLPKETADRSVAAIKQTLKTGETVQLEYELPIGSESVWFLASLSKLNEENVFWVARDITSRKLAEQDLAKFKLGIQNSGDAIFITDQNGIITFANPAFESVYGFKPEEAVGHNPRLIKSGIIPLEQYKNFWATLLSKQAVTGELINRHKDGHLVPIAGTNSPILDEKGDIIGFLAVHHDITDSKRAEESLQRRNTYLAASADISRLVTSTLDLNTIFKRTVNLVCERFGFYHAGIFIVEETGFNANLQEASGDAGEAMKVQRHSLGVGSNSIVGEVTQKGEALVVNDIAASPLHKLNPLLPDTKAEAAIPLRVGNRIIGALDIQSEQANAFSEDDIAVLQTLSDQVAVAIDNARSYELSLQAVKEMREIDRLKTTFLANMSHELRTPLNSIIGFSRVILKGIDGPITELQQTDLTAIYNSGQHLLGLINDILDLSKIEAGKMELAFEEVNVTDVITSVMSTVAGLVKDKPIRLVKHIPEELPHAHADPIRIRQVLINLFSNAAKFTDEGDITVNVQMQTGSTGKPEIRISVTDTGPGIAEKDQSKLFQPFSQVDDLPTRKTGGSGLGLSISQRLIHMHGGEIGLQSEVGHGSTFFFTLPVYREQNINTTNGKLILAIDDDPQVISLYERYLQSAGYQVIALSDPSQAVKRVAELKPFAVTLDIMMPGVDGWQVLTELKSNPETRDVPVMICSIIEEQQRGFSLGAAEYLVKPIMEEDMIKALDRLNLDGSIREVLVIDDNPNDLNLMGKMLNDHGQYKPTLANGGAEGWEIIVNKPPQAVILDLFMPGMDGFNILEKMRANKQLSEIPVIVVSSGDLTPEQRKQLSDYGQQLISKSALSGRDLVVSLERALQRVKAP